METLCKLNGSSSEQTTIIKCETTAVRLISLEKQPPEVFYKKAILKNLAIFTGKHLCWSLFLISFFQKKDSNTMNVAKFLRTSILKNICKRLLFSLKTYFLSTPLLCTGPLGVARTPANI